MMSFDPELIDRIVRDVLARLRGGDVGVSRPRELVLDEPVLTEDSLADRVNGHAEIIIGRRTVLTPTARDFLRSRSITFTRLGESPDGGAPASTGDRLAIVASESEAVHSAVTAVGWSHDETDCWKVATERAVDAVTSGASGVVVFSEQDAAVGCIANRNPAIRAAIVDDAHGVRAAREMIGPNVLVVDPTGKTFVTLREILREFAAGSTSAPIGWEEPR